MRPGLVSTIIPVFNRPTQLAEAVGSVLAQSHRPIEIIIVDDGSTDRTPDVAEALRAANPNEIRVFTQRNAGPGAARERGRTAADGEFIQYLDSDDILLPEKFKLQVAALRADPRAGVAYGITLFRDASGRRPDAAHKDTGRRIAAMFPLFLRSRWWETATPLYRSNVTDLAGPWTDLRLEEDWEYDCRIASLNGRLAWVDTPVCEHRDHGGQRLSRGEATDAQRLRDRAASHGLILSHALRAGIRADAPEMRHFSRELFLLARQCGAAGLGDESRRLFALSRQASGFVRGLAPDYLAYRTLAAVAGWQRAGKAGAWLDTLRPGR